MIHDDCRNKDMSHNKHGMIHDSSINHNQRIHLSWPRWFMTDARSMTVAWNMTAAWIQTAAWALTVTTVRLITRAGIIMTMAWIMTTEWIMTSKWIIPALDHNHGKSLQKGNHSNSSSTMLGIVSFRCRKTTTATKSWPEGELWPSARRDSSTNHYQPIP